MKKVFVVLTALVLLAMNTPVRVRAAGLAFTVGTISAARGETITVPIIVDGNPGFTAVGLTVTYDPNVLEITNVSAPAAAMPLNSQHSLTATPGTQQIHLINTDLTDWTGNGAVANMTFNVKSNAAAGVSGIALSFTGLPDGTPTNAYGAVLADAGVFSGYVNVAVSGVMSGGSTATAGGFIGAGSIPDGTQSGDKIAVNQPFGGVPQTGVPGITWAVAGMCASFMVSVVLLVYLARRKKSGSA